MITLLNDKKLLVANDKDRFEVKDGQRIDKLRGTSYPNWVLENLITQDNYEDDLVKNFYKYFEPYKFPDIERVHTTLIHLDTTVIELPNMIGTTTKELTNEIIRGVQKNK